MLEKYSVIFEAISVFWLWEGQISLLGALKSKFKIWRSWVAKLDLKVALIHDLLGVFYHFRDI